MIVYIQIQSYILMFLIDKYGPPKRSKYYNPTQMQAYDPSRFFHRDIMNKLRVMCNDESIPHIIFYGDRGSGKKTIIREFLEMLYDESVNDLYELNYEVTGSGNKTTDVPIKQSHHHIVIEPNNNNFDRYLIQEIVKAHAKKAPLQVFARNRSFKTVLINNLDNLSYYAQTSLRRTMEIYSHNCRFVMWCRSLSKVIDPLKSRCICIKVSNPSDIEIMNFIMHINYRESLRLSLDDIVRVMSRGNRNIKTTMWELELVRLRINKSMGYNTAIQKLVNTCLKRDVSYIPAMRAIVYDIMITNINSSQIFVDFINNICDNTMISDRKKYHIIQMGARYEHNLIRSRREIVNFDAFLTGVIKVLNETETPNAKHDDISNILAAIN